MPAEEKALDLVADHDDLEEALWFLLYWPEPHRAARLVLAAPKPLNGDRYYLLWRHWQNCWKNASRWRPQYACGR
jgi:hypothetical protein